MSNTYYLTRRLRSLARQRKCKLGDCSPRELSEWRAADLLERQENRIRDYQQTCTAMQEIINRQKEEIERLRAASTTV